MKMSWAAGVVACVLVWSLPAQALVEARVAVGGVGIVLDDLDARDGIEPKFEDAPAFWSQVFRDRYFFDLRESLPSPEVEGDGSLSFEVGAIGGSASSPRSSFFAADDIYPEATALRVTPFTRMTLLVPYRLDTVLVPEHPPGSEVPKAFAVAELLLFAINNLRVDGDTGEVLFDELPFSRDEQQLKSLFGVAPLGADSREGYLMVSFDNASATDAVFGYRAELVAFGSTGNVAAVPEAGTLALWLAGGLLLAATARRRRL